MRIEPASPAHLDALDELFSTGDPRRCQCAYVRLSNAGWNATSVEQRRAVRNDAIRTAHAEGRAAGLVALDGDQAVGWVSFDRRERYARLVSSRLLAPVDDQAVLSVACFVVAASARRQGVAADLLAATLDWARDHDERLLESYPVDVGPTTKRSAASLWRGTVPMFERAGFTTVEVRRQHAASAPRPIMRRHVRPR